MGWRSCWLEGGTTISRIAGSTALQNFRNFKASKTSTFATLPALMDYWSMFPGYNNYDNYNQLYIISIGLRSWACSPSFLSILHLTKTHPLPPILRTCPSLTCRTSDILLVMPIWISTHLIESAFYSHCRHWKHLIKKKRHWSNL